jgi:hypothetical protein
MKRTPGPDMAFKRLQQIDPGFIEALSASIDPSDLQENTLWAHTRVSTVAQAMAQAERLTSLSALERRIRDRFRDLQTAGFGRLLVGRKGMWTRFEWPGEMLRQFATMLPPKKQPTGATDGPTLVKHSFSLRPNVTVELKLPSDLTRTEATRLARFVEALSFEGIAGSRGD